MGGLRCPPRPITPVAVGIRLRLGCAHDVVEVLSQHHPAFAYKLQPFFRITTPPNSLFQPYDVPFVASSYLSFSDYGC